MKNENEQQLWNQFTRLGEMMGDGLHHEPDGRWISAEYRKLARILIPEHAANEKVIRTEKNKRTDEQMQKLLEQRKCTCGGTLKQIRSGSKKCKCIICTAKYTAR